MNNPFPYADAEKRYHTYDYYLKHTYGSKCAKIPIDAGFSCPNREHGSGCIFCSPRGSGEFCAAGTLPPQVQFAKGYTALSAKWKKRLPAIPYFQAFTCTYAAPEVLKKLYEEALCYTDADGNPVPAAGLNIATRPDCLPPETIDVLSCLAEKTDLVIELGLQSIHDSTLRTIRRGHDAACFLDAFARLRNAGIPVCVHIINGLPGETPDMMLETAEALARIRPDFVKIHMLHVLNHTPLAAWYEQGTLSLLSMEEYVDITCRQLELLPPETVIARLTGDGDQKELLAPLWTKNKRAVFAAVDRWFVTHASMQGIRYRQEETPCV